MIPLIAALLVALAIYSNAKLLQNHFFFRIIPRKFLSKKYGIRYLSVDRPYVFKETQGAIL